MRPKSGSFRGLLTFTFAVIALAGCASQSSTTTLTAATVPAPVPTVPSTQTEVECVAHQDDGSAALYVHWEGESGKGILRRTAASGATADTRIRASRLMDLIVTDDPTAPDRSHHIAMVGQHDNNRYLRLDSNPNWVRCE
jgi:hypothetical protein